MALKLSAYTFKSLSTIASNKNPNVSKSFINLSSSFIFNNAHAIEGSAKCLFSDCFTLIEERILEENGSSLSNKYNLFSAFK